MALEDPPHWQAAAHVDGKKMMTWSGPAVNGQEAKATLKTILALQWRQIAGKSPMPKHEVSVKTAKGITGLTTANAYPYLWSLAQSERSTGPGPLRSGVEEAIASILTSDPIKRADVFLDATIMRDDIVFGFYGSQGIVKGLTGLTRRAATALTWCCGLRDGDLASGGSTHSATLSAAAQAILIGRGAMGAETGARHLEELGLRDLANAIRAQARSTHGGRHAD